MRCEGLPVALETVGGYLRLRPDITPSDVLLELLDVRRTLKLSTEDPTALPGSVEAVFEMNFRALPPGLQRAYARLCVFPGSFSHDAALAVAGEASSVTELHRHRVIRFDSSTRRYDMLDLVRSFGEAKQSVDDREAALLAFARFFTDYGADVAQACEADTTATFLSAIAAFDREALNLDTVVHLLSHRIGHTDEWARLALKLAPLVSHPRVVESFTFVSWTHTVARSAEILGDAEALRHALLDYGIAVSRTHSDAIFPNPRRAADAILRECRDLARKAGDMDLTRRALDELVWCARLDGLPEATLEYLSEKLLLERHGETNLELLFDLVLTWDVALTEGFAVPAVANFEVGPRQAPHTYGALVLYDTLKAFLWMRRMLEYQLRAIKNSLGESARGPYDSYTDYLAFLVVTGEYVNVEPLAMLRGALVGISSLLPQFPINCVPYLNGITPEQAANWFEIGSSVALAVGRSVVAAHMNLIRSSVLKQKGDFQGAKDAAREAVKLSEGEIGNEDVRRGSKMILRELRQQSSGGRKKSKKRK